jgi:hypothetical protein
METLSACVVVGVRVLYWTNWLKDKPKTEQPKTGLLVSIEIFLRQIKNI